MSDYYDSLEDECDENKYSSDFPKKQETPSEDFTTTVSENESAEKYSFYLSRNVSKKRINILPNFQVSRARVKSNSEKKNFLPEIGNDVNENGSESLQNLFVDKHTLSKQGLQLNNDGSFTKSPRPDSEELPFITQKYRHIQFMKKSSYKVDKKYSFKKVQRKNMFSFTKKPVDGINMIELIRARNEKGSSEEVLTSRGSSVSILDYSKTNEQLPSKDNLTDSMKEKLLQSQKDSPFKVLKTTNNIIKTKRESNLLENCEKSRRNKFSPSIKCGISGEQAKSVFSKEHCLKDSISLNDKKDHKKKHKSPDLKIFKYQSAIIRDTVKPKFNYSELRLLKNGYNPMYLRYRSKKVQSDTDRSNFGDSAVEEFPEILNLTSNRENWIRDEKEELFYQKLIEMDRNKKQHIQLSTRSESPPGNRKLKEENEINSCKDQTEVRKNGKDNFSRRRTAKSISIDLPPEIDYSVNTFQKFSHYCTADPSWKVSKVELAIKAKTYGYLVNARNIFRLKAQSERRSFAFKKDENPKNIVKMYPTDMTVNLSRDSDRSSKHNSSVEEESFKTLEKLPRTTKSFCKAKCLKVATENEEELVLPPVNSPEVRNNQKKILHRISSCLKNSSG